jgi:hypothetical protein
MPPQRPSTTKPSTRKLQKLSSSSTNPSRRNINTAGANMKRPKRNIKNNRKLLGDPNLVIPGEFFFKSFNKQLGEKTGLVTWTHHKEMRKIHCDQIRYAQSHVQLDVQAHREKVKRTRELVLDPVRDARVKMLVDRKIKLANDDLVRRIKKRLAEPTIITDAASSLWRKRHIKYKVVRKKLQAIANEEKTRYRNRDNMELLHLIENAIPYYDPKEWDEAFQRHIRLKKAMRKVDDPEKKKKTKDQKQNELLNKPEKLKTKSEALLSELYSHAMSPEFVKTYCDTIQKEKKEKNNSVMPQLVQQQNSSLLAAGSPTVGSSNGGNSLLLSSAAPGMNSPQDFQRYMSDTGFRSGFTTNIDGDEDWNDQEQAKLLIMMPQKMNLGGKDVLVGVYRSKESELALRIVIEDLFTFAQRSVYLTYKAMHRMTQRYPQLLDDTFSAIRAGKERNRDKGNRIKSLLLLLDLSGAFKREIVRLPPSPNARARTAMSGKRSPHSWQRAPGTAGTSSRRKKNDDFDMSLVIDRPRTVSGLRSTGSVILG